MTTDITNFTANATNTLIATLGSANTSLGLSGVRIDAYGTFSSGTMTFSYSPDDGTTKIAMKTSVGGSAVSLTENEGFVFTAPIYNGNAAIKLYATLAGAGSPNINIKVSNPQAV